MVAFRPWDYWLSVFSSFPRQMAILYVYCFHGGKRLFKNFLIAKISCDWKSYPSKPHWNYAFDACHLGTFMFCRIHYKWNRALPLNASLMSWNCSSTFRGSHDNLYSNPFLGQIRHLVPGRLSDLTKVTESELRVNVMLFLAESNILR